MPMLRSTEIEAMASEIPSTMRSLVAPRKCSPKEYVVCDMPTPSITHPTEVLLRIKAAAINTGDTQVAKMGGFGPILKVDLPMKIAFEGSGVIVAVGSQVKTLKVGDEVYGMCMDKPMFRGPMPGFASEYAVSHERFLIHKPSHVSFEEAASYPGLVVTAIQSIRRSLQLRGEESLEGKTVYIPGALSGTGSMVIQVARQVFGAAKIISTVSTPKMGLVEQYLPGQVDQLIDYTKQNVKSIVPRGSVDFAYNTQWDGSLDDCISVLEPTKGTLILIAGLPSKKTATEIFGADIFPFWAGWLLDLAQLWYSWKLRGTSVKYEMVSGGPQIRDDLEKMGEVVALGKVKPVMRVVDLEDLEAVRAGCEQVFSGKGGVGKLVIRIP